MKKIFIISALVLTSFLGTQESKAVPLSTPAPIQLDPSDVRPVGPIEVNLHPATEVTPQEGDIFYLCAKGEVDLLMTKDNNEQITFTGLGKNPYKDGGILGIGSKDNHKAILIKNENNAAKFENTTVWMLFSAPQLDMIFDTNGDSDSYVEYVAVNSNHSPCSQLTAPVEAYSVHAQGLALHVKEIVEAQPEAAAPVASPEAPLSPAADNSAPQSGGCSMSAGLNGINYGFSSLFSLILGAHAILRCRKNHS